MKDEDCNTAKSQGQVVAITENKKRACACLQEKYCKVCIAKAALSESLCEDFHTEHM